LILQETVQCQKSNGTIITQSRRGAIPGGFNLSKSRFDEQTVNFCAIQSRPACGPLNPLPVQAPAVNRWPPPLAMRAASELPALQGKRCAKFFVGMLKNFESLLPFFAEIIYTKYILAIF